jgi:hypothetical protein
MSDGGSRLELRHRWPNCSSSRKALNVLSEDQCAKEDQYLMNGTFRAKKAGSASACGR